VRESERMIERVWKKGNTLDEFEKLDLLAP
jgi:hypothetical protein